MNAQKGQTHTAQIVRKPRSDNPDGLPRPSRDFVRQLNPRAKSPSFITSEDIDLVDKFSHVRNSDVADLESDPYHEARDDSGYQDYRRLGGI